MRRPKHDHGIAIVSVLMILAAVMLMGIAGMFLTQMNLNISRNVQTSSQASSNAASGMSGAFAALQAYYDANGALPSSLTLPTIAGQGYDPSFSLQSYKVSGQTAYVSILGTAGAKAEYQSEALIRFVASSGLPSYFAYGLASEGTVTASGNAAYVNAGVHGNKGFTISGNQYFYVCTKRDADGTCKTEVRVDSDAVPVSASPGATTCKVSGNPGDYKLCKDGKPVSLTDPVTITPDVASRLAGALAEVSHGSTHSNVLGIDCDYIFASTPNQATFKAKVQASPAGSTLCVEGNGKLSLSGSGYALNDVNVVLKDGISFSGNYSTKNLTLISLQGSVTGSGNSDFESMRVFASQDVTFSGNHDLTGRSTFASGADLRISGNAAAVSNAAGDAAIGVVLVAEGDITVSGNSKLFIAAVAGGTFKKSGNAELYGRIASKGDLTVSGNFDIDSGFPIDNDDIATGEPPKLQVVSLR